MGDRILEHKIWEVDTNNPRAFIVRGYTYDQQGRRVCKWEYETTIDGKYVNHLFFQIDWGIRKYGNAQVFYTELLDYKGRISSYLRPFHRLQMILNGSNPQRPTKQKPHIL